MKRRTWARGAGLVVLAAAALAGCGPKTAGGANPSAVASSAGAAASAYATSKAGQAAKAEAVQIAAACKTTLGAQGYNAMAPGVPGAQAARKAFYGCEKIPKARVFAWVACLGGVYAHAPAKGTQGSAAENTRQQAITVGAGTCTATAKGIKLGGTGTANIPGATPTSAGPS